VSQASGIATPTREDLVSSQTGRRRDGEPAHTRVYPSDLAPRVRQLGFSELSDFGGYNEKDPIRKSAAIPVEVISM